MVMAAYFLLPFGWLYFFLYAARRAWCKRRQARRLPVPVVSVGNITTGGTGKTEMAALLCRALAKLGGKPGVLLRGYRRKSRQPLLIVSEGRGGPKVNVEAAGDEAFLLARRLPEVPVIVGRDRFAAGQEAIRRFGCTVLVLDDGFQRRDQVARDVDMVLLDASDPWGGGRLLPAGRLREPLNSLKEADLLVLTRADQYATPTIFARISELAPSKPVFTARHAPKMLTALHGGRVENPEYLSQRRVLAVAGIGCPDSFVRSLVKLKAVVVKTMKFPDHHWYTAGDCRMLQAQARALDAEIVTTAKDAVRINYCNPEKCAGWVLEVEMEIIAPATGLTPYLSGLAQQLQP
ncbi:tetraacyldisaccharide 4'-kinase [candidate division FCPU426 bacterium]|nr:tetraacyldisaccharide 4'-kinase [candidate division FCPU426 bacterium]